MILQAGSLKLHKLETDRVVSRAMLNGITVSGDFSGNTVSFSNGLQLKAKDVLTIM